MAGRADELAKKFDAKVREAPGRGDVELDRSGTVITGMPAPSAARLADGYLVGHIDEHRGRIRATVGS